MLNVIPAVAFFSGGPGRRCTAEHGGAGQGCVVAHVGERAAAGRWHALANAHEQAQERGDAGREARWRTREGACGGRRLRAGEGAGRHGERQPRRWPNCMASSGGGRRGPTRGGGVSAEAQRAGDGRARRHDQERRGQSRVALHSGEEKRRMRVRVAAVDRKDSNICTNLKR